MFELDFGNAAMDVIHSAVPQKKESSSTMDDETYKLFLAYKKAKETRREEFRFFLKDRIQEVLQKFSPSKTVTMEYKKPIVKWQRKTNGGVTKITVPGGAVSFTKGKQKQVRAYTQQMLTLLSMGDLSQFYELALQGNEKNNKWGTRVCKEARIRPLIQLIHKDDSSFNINSKGVKTYHKACYFPRFKQWCKNPQLESFDSICLKGQNHSQYSSIASDNKKHHQQQMAKKQA